MVEYEVDHVRDDRTVYLQKDLDHALKRIRDYTVNDDDDSLIFVDGLEGSGKSKTARQIGYVMSKWNDTSFGLENIHNDLESYKEQVMDVDDPEDFDSGRVAILDEAKNTLDRLRQMSSSNVDFTNFMSENRDFNMHHIICAPAFHDIDPNTVKWRMNFLVHMKKGVTGADSPDYMSGERLQRGGFEAYENDEELLYAYNNKYQYPDSPAIQGWFKDVEVLSDEELRQYKKQKHEEMREKYAEGGGFTDLQLQALGAVLEHAKSNRDVTTIFKEYEDKVDMAQRTFRDKINTFLDEEIGGGLEGD